jgi:hypothetical protein
MLIDVNQRLLFVFPAEFFGGLSQALLPTAAALDIV